MWKLSLASALVLASFCLAAQKQQPNEDVDDAVLQSIFGDATNPNQPDGNSPTPEVNNNNAVESDCECVPYYQCSNGTVVDNGVGIIDIRSGFANP